MFKILSSLFSSYSKSRKVWKLEHIIWPPEKTTSVTFDLEELRQDKERQDKYLEEYIDLCERDEGVFEVMNEYKLTRTDLKYIYEKLVMAGMGQYVKGHFLALSSIAYYEPLLYYVASERNGKDYIDIAGGLMDYWQGRIQNGGLLKLLKLDE